MSACVELHPAATADLPSTSGALMLESRVRRALQAMRDGRPVVLFDDDDRENEADLIVAAQCLTLETMAQLIRDCSGIVCLCLPEDLADRLDLPPMVERNGSRHGTAFTVSIEAREGVSTGVSAADRLRTVQVAIGADAGPQDLVRPGHVFPLRARTGGVLARRGHTSSFLTFGTAEDGFETRHRVLHPEEAARESWDAVMVPGGGFPDATIEGFADLRAPNFGARIQHFLNAPARRDAYARVTRTFAPDLVVANNAHWDDAALDALGLPWRRLVGAVDAGIDEG